MSDKKPEPPFEEDPFFGPLARRYSSVYQAAADKARARGDEGEAREMEMLAFMYGGLARRVD